MWRKKRNDEEVQQSDVLATNNHIIRFECGPTGDGMFCACGCGGDDSRCQYWIDCYEAETEVDEDHTCCKVRKAGEPRKLANP